VATVIHLSSGGNSGDVWILVKEEPSEVQSRFSAAAGVPFELTQTDRRDGRVFVNPGALTYWHEAEEQSR
jgi:hypothetical protein